MPAPVTSLGPVAYLEAMEAAARVMEDHAVAIDRLDRPTPPDPAVDRGPGVGTDLAATLSEAVQGAEGCRDLASVCEAMERGAQSGARGRTGRGAATLLAGIGEVLRNADAVDATRFALALEAAAERLAPVDDGRRPGSFAAVVSVVADAALAASDGGADLGDTIVSAAAAGIEELERGPEADARLAERGTVDAAAAGLLLVLDTLASVVTGEPLPAPPPEMAPDSGPDASGGGAGGGPLRYDVSCALEPDAPGVEVAADLESLLVARGCELTAWEPTGTRWRIALRTPRPGAAVEALVEVGRPRELHIGLSAGRPGATAPPVAAAGG